MKVNKPISKKEIFDFLYPTHVHLLLKITQFHDLKEMLEDYTNIEDWLENEFGYETSIPKVVEIINGYFRIFEYEEIDCSYLNEDEDNESNNNNLYKNLIIGNEDRDYYIIRHNL